MALYCNRRIRSKLIKYIDNSIRFFGTVNDYERYVNVRIDALSVECCCVQCFPKTWKKIKDYCDSNIETHDSYCYCCEKYNERIIIESTEGGPEFVICLDKINNIENLLKIMMEITKIYIDGRPKEKIFCMSSEYRIKRFYKKVGIERGELLHTFDYPPDTKSNIEIYKVMKKAIEDELYRD